MPPAPLPLSNQSKRTGDSPISYFIQKAIETPGLISLAAGLVDESSLPVDHCARLTATILSDPVRARRALQYGTTLGLRALREKLLAHICALESKPASAMGLSADHILLSTGSQQSLYIIADVLVDPGDIVITANPSYFVFTGALQSLGARCLGP